MKRIRNFLFDRTGQGPALAIGAALFALLVNAAIPIYSFHSLNQSYSETIRTRDTIEAIDAVLISMIDAETGERGYTITGNPAFLEPYHNGVTKVDSQLSRLEVLLTGNEAGIKALNDLKAKVAYCLQFIKNVSETRHAADFDHAADIVKTGEGKIRMDAVRVSAAKLRAIELQRLEFLAANVNKTVALTDSILIILTLIDFVVFSIAFKLLFNLIKSIKTAQDALEELHSDALKHSELLERRNKTKELQSRLVDVLQAVSDPQEAYVAIARYVSICFQAIPAHFISEAIQKITLS